MSKSKPPKAAAIRDVRRLANLTQAEAAKIVFAGLRTWSSWESGATTMHPAIFAWFVTCCSVRVKP